MITSKTLLDEWSVKDLEDGSSLTVSVYHNPEMGNAGKPGVQVYYLGYIVNFEPLTAERWAWKATRQNQPEYLLEEYSWMVHYNQYVKVYLVTSPALSARVVVKSRTSQPITKDFPLPFSL